MPGQCNIGSRIEGGNLVFFDDTSATKAPVLVLATGATNSAPQMTYAGSVTLAQLNAGLTLVPAVTGRTYTVTGIYLLTVGSNPAVATDIRISDTAASPVDALTVLIANATSAAAVTELGGTGITLGTFAAALTASKGIQIRKTGSTMTGPTSFTVRINYTVA